MSLKESINTSLPRKLFDVRSSIISPSSPVHAFWPRKKSGFQYHKALSLALFLSRLSLYSLTFSIFLTMTSPSKSWTLISPALTSTLRTPSALAMVTRLLPTLTFSSIPWFLIQVSPLEILTMLMPLTFLIKMVRSFSTCISLPPNSSREISLPFSSLTQTSPRIVIEGEEGEEDFDLFFGGEEEEAEAEMGGRFLRWAAGEPALGEGGAKMEEKGSLFSPAGAEEEEEEEEATTPEADDDDFLEDFVTSSSPSSSLPLDKLANFSLTSLILGSEENLGIPGTPRFGDLPLALRSSSSSAADDDVVDEALDIF